MPLCVRCPRQVFEFWEAIWASVRRRGSLLSMSLMYAFTGMPMVSAGGHLTYGSPIYLLEQLHSWETAFPRCVNDVLGLGSSCPLFGGMRYM